MASTLRLFIAVELPDEVLRYISETVGELRRHGITGIRWVRGEGVHLTLKFLGNASEEQVAGILSSMRSTVAGTSPFALQVHGAGAFPHMRAPRVLWLGVQGDMEPLFRVHDLLEEALEVQGFAREARTFSAHLTLGRVNGRMTAVALDRLAHAIFEPNGKPACSRRRDLPAGRSGPSGIAAAQVAADYPEGGGTIRNAISHSGHLMLVCVAV